MPGICCLAGKAANQQHLLQSMAESIKHEDWHRVDMYSAPDCGIARVHLGIFNPEPQPIFNADESRLIFMDGKIYDYEDAKRDLQSRGHKFRFASNDAEFCLHLYEESGKDFAKKLNGTFAIVIYDIKQRKLLVINDRFGLRPVYYYTTGNNRLLVASEVKALLQVEPEPELNDEAVADWFFYNKLLGTKTFFKNIDVLPPASVLEYSDGKLNIGKYWDFTFDRAAGIGEEELVEGLVSSFKTSVARRLSGKYRYGIGLSGGLDSRSIVAAMGDRAPEVTAFTFGGKGCDEIRIASSIAAGLGMKHHVIELNPDKSPDYFRDVVYLSDGMDHIGVNYLPQAYEEYRKHVEVNFNGLEGDVILGEYFLDSNLRQAGGEEEITQALYASNRALPESMWRNLFQPSYYQRIKDLPLESLRREVQQTQGKQPGDRATHFAIRNVVWRLDLMGCVIGRNKLEEAYPFFDNDFMDWVQRIPPDLRLNYRIYRQFLKGLSPTLAKVTRQWTGVSASAPVFLSNTGKYYQQGKAALKLLLYRLSGGNIYLRNTFSFHSLNEFFLVNEKWRKAVREILEGDSPLSAEYLNTDYIGRLLDGHGKILPPNQFTRNRSFTANYSLPLTFIVSFELFLKLFFKQ